MDLPVLPEIIDGFFPSLSAGWVISEENFMKSTRKVLDFLKVRASYGLLGNQNIGNYPYAATIATGYGYYLGGEEADKELVSGVAQTTLANSDISWEKSKQINFGIDFKGGTKVVVDFGDSFDKVEADGIVKEYAPDAVTKTVDEVSITILCRNESSIYQCRRYVQQGLGSKCQS